MSVSATTLEKLMAAGLHGEALLDVVRSIEADIYRPRSAGAIRQARYRKKQEQETVTSNVTRDATSDVGHKESTPLHPPKENKNPSLRREGEKAADSLENHSLPAKTDAVAEAFEAYNDLAKRIGLSPARLLNPARRAAIRARLGEAGGIDGWRAALRELEASPFCRGEGPSGWRADIAFVCQPNSFARLVDGGYRHLRGPPNGHAGDPEKARKEREFAILMRD